MSTANMSEAKQNIEQYTDSNDYASNSISDEASRITGEIPGTIESSQRMYVAIDLKSFYASVECMERGLDPLTAHLVVADASRTSKTICLAVSPALKSYGVPGRPRLFEVEQKVREINNMRRYKQHIRSFKGKAKDSKEIAQHPDWEVDFHIAPPQMARYMETSGRIYGIYLRYIAPEDMHVYSIDEVFIDVTPYLKTYKMTATQLAQTMVHAVYQETGITATAGIGTNLYLAKIAMDILAKHMSPGSMGERIAELDDMSYRKLLWNHTPLTDFWRIGRGYSKKLQEHGLYTMGDIARCSLAGSKDYRNEDFLYKLFGINAELLIDHAWGWEPCLMKDIKSYHSKSNSLSSGQVLQRPYGFQEARLVAWEMTESLALDMVEKGLETSQMGLRVGYDIENLDSGRDYVYDGAISIDVYGRKKPKSAHGTRNLGCHTCSSKKMSEAITSMFDELVDVNLTVRRITIVANYVLTHEAARQAHSTQQLSLFDTEEGVDGTTYIYPTQIDSRLTAVDMVKEESAELKGDRIVGLMKQANDSLKEQRLQETMLQLKKRYGKNAILKGANLQEAATMQQRNQQIGGHKA